MVIEGFLSRYGKYGPYSVFLLPMPSNGRGSIEFVKAENRLGDSVDGVVIDDGSSIIDE